MVDARPVQHYSGGLSQGRGRGTRTTLGELTQSDGTMKSLADPTNLKPIDKKDGLLQVIVETPAGSRNKFAFDPDQHIFALKKVLPAGMVFPYDFGFLPKTLAPDGSVATLGAERLLYAGRYVQAAKSKRWSMNLICRRRSFPATHRICPFRIMWTAS